MYKWSSDIMTRRDVVDKLMKFFVDTVLDGDASGFDTDTPLLEAGILDSITVLQLADFVAKEFGVMLGPDQLTLDKLENIDVIAAEILKLLTEKNGNDG